MGVRLKPSLFYLLFHIEVYKIMDNQISFDDIEKEENINEIFKLNNTNRIFFLLSITHRITTSILVVILQ